VSTAFAMVGSAVAVTDLLSGQYEVAYTTNITGVRSLDIRSVPPAPLNGTNGSDVGEHISGSPFRIDTVPAATNPARSLVDGQGISVATAGIQVCPKP
jgi:hypothetical protein